MTQKKNSWHKILFLGTRIFFLAQEYSFFCSKKKIIVARKIISWQGKKAWSLHQ